MDFFREHPVFTSQEYAYFLEKERRAGDRNREASLAYHLKAGHLLHLKRGLYAVVPPGGSLESFIADPYLIAGKLSEDAVIGYHTALAFYGKSHSITHQFCVLTENRPTRLVIQQNAFRLVSFPQSLLKQQQAFFATKLIPYQGSELRVTSFERTLVDMLDRPSLSGEWEEIWRSLESVEYFDIDKVIKYTLLLNKATTTALVGFYLEQHQQELHVKETDLEILQAHTPKEPHYIDRQKKTLKKFNARWNLVIPAEIIEKSWKE
jgi:predicted transcriptional regulator of viral defense system